MAILLGGLNAVPRPRHGMLEKQCDCHDLPLGRSRKDRIICSQRQVGLFLEGVPDHTGGDDGASKDLLNRLKNGALIFDDDVATADHDVG